MRRNSPSLTATSLGRESLRLPDLHESRHPAKEAHRMLRSGGALGVTVWSTGDRVPALHALVAAMLEFAEPDETGYLPTPYELGGPGEMVRFLLEAGFREAKENRVTELFHFKDEDEYFKLLLDSTPFGHSLSEEDPEVQEKILRKARGNLQAWKTRSGLTLPAEIVIVTAKK